MDLQRLSSQVVWRDLQCSVLSFFFLHSECQICIKLMATKESPSLNKEIIDAQSIILQPVLFGLDRNWWSLMLCFFSLFFLWGFMKGFGQLWWLLMINLDQNYLSQKGYKTKQAWRGSSGLSYLSFVLKPEGKSGLVTLQRGLEDGSDVFHSDLWSGGRLWL